ncbi:MAG TPA: hypothetical protein VMM17_02955 [Gemmatimonadaceae bacterium]|nr:hypothetical protein [Gemmatimonadaceae bacterium]
MTCEAAWRRAEEAKSKWLEAEAAMMAAMDPLRARIESMTEANLLRLEGLVEDYCGAARESIQSLKSALMEDALHDMS